MERTEPTSTELACHVSHRSMLEAIALRDRLTAAIERDEANGFVRFERLYHAHGMADRRVNRRRLRWLALQRDVFVQLANEARTSVTRSDASESAARVSDALCLAALRSLVNRP